MRCPASARPPPVLVGTLLGPLARPTPVLAGALLCPQSNHLFLFSCDPRRGRPLVLAQSLPRPSNERACKHVNMRTSNMLLLLLLLLPSLSLLLLLLLDCCCFCMLRI